jgi:hypothetical protein
MSPNRQTLAILWLTLALGGLSWTLPHTTWWRAELAETNFQANLIRLQAFAIGPPPKAVIVGSSLSGRLLPSYFENTWLSPVANLGLDGSSASFGLGLSAERPPGLVLVELNTILKPHDNNDELLDSTVRSFGFQLSRRLPPLQARGRPSSVLYSWIKSHQRGRPGSEPLPAPSVVASKPETQGASPIQNTQLVRDEIRAQIQKLVSLGSRVVLVRLPWGNRNEASNPAFEFGGDLARELKLAQIDLEQECARRGHVLRYTDGLHLAPASAREASRTLAELAAASSPAMKP